MAKIIGVDPEIRTDEEARANGYIFKIVGREDLTAYAKNEADRDAVIDWLKRQDCPNPITVTIG